MNNNKNYYQILGISRNARPLEIKRAFQLQSLVSHANRICHDTEELRREYRIIKNSYEILSDSQKRQLYDKWLDSNCTCDLPIEIAPDIVPDQVAPRQRIETPIVRSTSPQRCKYGVTEDNHSSALLDAYIETLTAAGYQRVPERYNDALAALFRQHRTSLTSFPPDEQTTRNGSTRRRHNQRATSNNSHSDSGIQSSGSETDTNEVYNGPQIIRIRRYYRRYERIHEFEPVDDDENSFEISSNGENEN